LQLFSPSTDEFGGFVPWLLSVSGHWGLGEAEGLGLGAAKRRDGAVGSVQREKPYQFPSGCGKKYVFVLKILACLNMPARIVCINKLKTCEQTDRL
jgi:hypothetical protein